MQTVNYITVTFRGHGIYRIEKSEGHGAVVF